MRALLASNTCSCRMSLTILYQVADSTFSFHLTQQLDNCFRRVHTLQPQQLPVRVWDRAVQVMDLFEQAKLKGQKLNLATLLSKSEFKQQYLAPIRVMEEDEQCQLLDQVITHTISLQELRGEAEKLKNIRALCTAFLRLTNTGSCEEAVQLYPQFTTDDQIKRFLYCDLKKVYRSHSATFVSESRIP